MKFTVTIDCNHAAFHDDDGDPCPEWELSRILRELALDIERFGAAPRATLMDINCNRVGTAHFEEN